MKPADISTKIFLDSGDPKETEVVKSVLGWLDGQTTNPTLLARNPAVKQMAENQALSEAELEDAYRQIIERINKLIPGGDISIEVYADAFTPAEQMVDQGRRFAKWANNPYIKLPITSAGIEAAQQLLQDGIKVNMTLCFSQEQAAAVYTATAGLSGGNIFISPFVGRLDDRGVDGLSLVFNIQKMLKDTDGHLQVLAASIRSVEHLSILLETQVDAVTVPAKVLLEWDKAGRPIGTTRRKANLTPLPYQEFDLRSEWKSFNINHSLTDIGLEKFAADWQSLIVAKN